MTVILLHQFSCIGVHCGTGHISPLTCAVLCINVGLTNCQVTDEVTGILKCPLLRA